MKVTATLKQPFQTGSGRWIRQGQQVQILAGRRTNEGEDVQLARIGDHGQPFQIPMYYLVRSK